MVNGTWESLKVNETRGLLVGTGVPHVLGLGYMSIYDVSQDCAHPRLLNEGRGSVLGMRIAMITHEGNFSPDGNTYWASGQIWASAVDISDPTNPHVIWSAPAGLGSHGMEFTPDGDTMFMSTMPGVNVLDTTAIQDRAQPGFTMHQLLPSADSSTGPTARSASTASTSPTAACPTSSPSTNWDQAGQALRRIRPLGAEAAQRHQAGDQPARTPRLLGHQRRQQRILRL